MSAFVPSGRSELARTLWAFRREFWLVVVLSLVTNVLMLTPTLYMLQLFDRVLVSRSEFTLLAVSVLVVLLFGVGALAEWIRARVLVVVGVRLDQVLSPRVFSASFHASLSSSGVDPAKAFSDLVQLRQFVTGTGVYALVDAPWSPLYVAVLFYMHPLLGALALVFMVVHVVQAWLIQRRSRGVAHRSQLDADQARLYLQGKLRNAEVIEAMGMTAHLKQHWLARQHTHMASAGAQQAQTNRTTAWSKFTRYSQQSLVLGAGALLVIDGQITPGAMIASNLLMSRALAPVDHVLSAWPAFTLARDAYRRLDALLRHHVTPPTVPAQAPPTGQLALRNVTAEASGRERPILQNINLELQPGSALVVLGPSGSGKSTLARVIVGVWPQVQGEVLLGGRPLSSWDRHALGPHIGYLPQDIELFEGTVADNIARLGPLDVTRVVAAAKCVGLHDMILRFPKGYNTPIGEFGHLLSGGQRQRIGLARAVFGNPALVVLDEPNANLDDAGELALNQAVRELKANGSTVVLITHRQGALAEADHLLILENGTVRACGPRDHILQAMRASKAATASASRAPEPTA